MCVHFNCHSNKDVNDCDSYFSLIDIIVPNLIWQAGCTAEAIHTAGIACLFIAFKQHSSDFNSPFSDPDVLRSVVGPLLPLLLTLIEDSSKKTLLIICQTISRMIALTWDAGLYTADLAHQVYSGM